MVEADNECDLPCGKKLWDGYGRWNIYNKWKPFVDEINLPSSSGSRFFVFFDVSCNYSVHANIYWKSTEKNPT